MSIYIGEPVEYSDMQGPCPDGFHVPLQSERQAIYDAYTGLGLSGGTNFSVYLKIPFTGYRSYNNLSVYDRGSWGSYWSSTNLGSNRAYVLLLGNSDIYTQEYQYRSTACSIRGIKDTPVTPTSSWNKLYGTSIESGGIFHNVTDGLISISSDGSTWYTLMDKNLGATTVYNYGDTLSYTNCGNYYQRGNNYGFGWEDASQITQSSTQVNVTGYGPGNYYESSTWITTSTRQSSANDGNNLRGGVSQGTSTKSVEVQNIYIGEYKPNFATQGPCPDGFHVPLSIEWQSLYDAGVSLGAWTSSGGYYMNIYLKLPYTGYRDYSSTNVGNQNSNGNYWASDIYNNSQSYGLSFSGGSISPNVQMYKGYGLSIRPFKNTPVVPDSTWTELYSNSIYHNSTLGLISIKNGSSWITISDKNLGATTVYNYGDTMSVSNCGYYYQWGNNYLFPFSGTISTTSTNAVNANTYGPGNYYNSSTWIKRAAWDSSNNANLRGGVSQGSGTRFVEKQIYPSTH